MSLIISQSLFFLLFPKLLRNVLLSSLIITAALRSAPSSAVSLQATRSTGAAGLGPAAIYLYIYISAYLYIYISIYLFYISTYIHVAGPTPLPVGFPHQHQGPARHREVSLNDIFYFGQTHTEQTAKPVPLLTLSSTLH